MWGSAAKNAEIQASLVLIRQQNFDNRFVSAKTWARAASQRWQSFLPCSSLGCAGVGGNTTEEDANICWLFPPAWRRCLHPNPPEANFQTIVALAGRLMPSTPIPWSSHSNLSRARWCASWLRAMAVFSSINLGFSTHFCQTSAITCWSYQSIPLAHCILHVHMEVAVGSGPSSCFPFSSREIKFFKGMTAASVHSCHSCYWLIRSSLKRRVRVLFYLNLFDHAK